MEAERAKFKSHTCPGACLPRQHPCWVGHWRPKVRGRGGPRKGRCCVASVPRPRACALPQPEASPNERSPMGKVWVGGLSPSPAGAPWLRPLCSTAPVGETHVKLRVTALSPAQERGRKERQDQKFDFQPRAATEVGPTLPGQGAHPGPSPAILLLPCQEATLCPQAPVAAGPPGSLQRERWKQSHHRPPLSSGRSSVLTGLTPTHSQRCAGTLPSDPDDPCLHRAQVGLESD